MSVPSVSFAESEVSFVPSVSFAREVSAELCELELREVSAELREVRKVEFLDNLKGILSKSEVFQTTSERKFYPIRASELDLQWFAAEDEGKTEEPTEHKLEEARKEGRVAKSQEVAGALVLLLPVITMILLAPYIFKNCVGIFRFYFDRVATSDVTDPALIAGFFNYFLKIFLPIAAIAVVSAIAGNVIQTRGLIFSTKPIEPKFSKIAPNFSRYFKRTLFSTEGAFNIVKSIVKVAVIFLLSFFIIKNDLPNLLMLMKVSLWSGFRHLAGDAAKILLTSAIFFLLVSIPDYFVQRRQFRESMKMTKQEVKEEFKQMEGDPLVKSRLRQQMQQMLYQNLPKIVSEADVVITNPTHYAVVIAYNSQIHPAPMVTAKGEDDLAQRIKKIARDNDVEIVENKLLARELYAKVEIGDIIPEEYYSAISIILANVYSMKGKK